MRIYRIFRKIKHSLAFFAVAAGVLYFLPFFSPEETSGRNVIFQNNDSDDSVQDDEVSREITAWWDGVGLPEGGISGQVLYRRYYVASYSYRHFQPIWVAWRLSGEKADGAVERPDYAFHEDPEVSFSCRATLDDYRGCGYDRGHMCPAADCKWDKQVMYESFLLTNICPQDKDLNGGIWNRIEMSCRYWSKKYGTLYIVCGPLFTADSQTVGTHKIPVPRAFFKVVYCPKRDKGIAFLCPNEPCGGRIEDYVCTVEEIERLSGLVFFPELDGELSYKVKSRSFLNGIKKW